MAPEHGAIGVHFIQHDIAQVLEQPHPLCAVGQWDGGSELFPFGTPA
jgi:hypothetical protein